MEISKAILKNKIETFIYERLEKEKYEVLNNMEASSLLTWNRIDLAFKILYLELKEKNKELAKRIYFHDIRAQTLGSFIEYGNEEKNSLEKYLKEFEYTFNSISKNGFDEKHTLVPLANDNSILNGSHRVASAIYLEKKISCVKLDQNNMVADYQYFYKRNVPLDILDLVATKFIEYSENVYIAFLWPSGVGSKDEVERKFQNIVYKKEITLTPKGGYNLLFELYKHMEWIGTPKEGFDGIKQKLIECFPDFEPFTVIAFQANSLTDVRSIKEKIRQVYNIGFSSIHITDTKEEAIRISKLIFNDNGLHFLNYSEPNKFDSIYRKLEVFDKYLKYNNINKNDILIDGSLILSLYGIRKNEDVDFLLLDNTQIKEKNSEFDIHDSELKYHAKEKRDLIYDPSFYFQYKGFKYISFFQLYFMKSNRNEEKDINDCRMMEGLIENNQWKKRLNQLKQAIFYFKIKTSRTIPKVKKDINRAIMTFLKFTKLYTPIRIVYRAVKGKQ